MDSTDRLSLSRIAPQPSIPSGRDASRTTEGPKQAEWEAHKEEIRVLYQHYPLKQVKQILEERGFVATSDKEYQVAMLLLEERREAGKQETVFVINGHARSVKDLRKYIKGRKMTDEQFSQLARQNEAAGDLHEVHDHVRCGTPESDLSEMETHQSPTSASSQTESSLPLLNHLQPPIRASLPSSPESCLLPSIQGPNPSPDSHRGRRNSIKIRKNRLSDSSSHRIASIPESVAGGQLEMEGAEKPFTPPGSIPEAFQPFFTPRHSPSSCDHFGLEDVDMLACSAVHSNPLPGTFGIDNQDALKLLNPPLSRTASGADLSYDVQAENLAQKALADADKEFEAIIRSEDPMIVLALNNTLTILHQHNQEKICEKIMKNTAAVAERILGVYSPIGTLTRYLGYAANPQKLLEQTEITSQRLRQVWDELVQTLSRGERDKRSIGALYCLGHCLNAEGYRWSSQDKFRESASVLQQCYRLSRDIAAAIGYAETAIKDSSLSLGIQHPKRLELMRNLALCYFQVGRETEAEELYWKVLEGRANMLGRDHEYTRAIAYDLQEYLMKQNRWQDANGEATAEKVRLDDIFEWDVIDPESADEESAYMPLEVAPVESSPVFKQSEGTQERPFQEAEDIHVALVKLSDLSRIGDDQLDGIAQTLSLLSRLSLTPCIVVEERQSTDEISWRQQVNAQADRLVSALATTRSRGGYRLNDILALGDDGRSKLSLPSLILRPLRRGVMPVIPSVAYTESTQKAVRISANEAIIALAKGFTATAGATSNQDPAPSEVSVDRVVVIDESGGIPSTKSVDKMHVFVNLEQEYHHLQEELRSSTDAHVSPQHASNLWMLRQALGLLPPSASGLITSPAEAANSRRTPQEQPVSNVGTRRRRNPLIHNLLTDKPAFSSSLPSTRLGTATTSTFVKQGMPLIILPHPAAQEWAAHKQPWIKLTDPRIDLDRLVYLINDSFDRKLDVDAYLKRVNDRMAGVIIAGDYEGGAILTWETPAGAEAEDKSRLVPYLDKFAVLKKSQGAGGVADIVFNAMVRSCFPKGVCWRSRKNNPVNKWYFERSRGSWKIPDTNWSMFWTTPGVAAHGQTFRDYEAVCRSVVPTWADDKKIED
ncbi:hypothetical protein DV735_g3683, partial [Chaetothyriales sp. CBS 134920]